MTQNYYFSANQNAKRLHGVPKWFSADVQSPCHRVSHTMTNKTRRRATRVAQPQKPKKATPFADAGAIVGSKVSTMFNAPWAKGVGRWLGSGIGQIFGSGDYQIVGASPDYNVLANGNQIPKFSTGRQTNIVCHREYLQDIQGTTAFTLLSFALNPGIASTFPWLSSIAQNYQEYKFHGLIFEFRPLITDFVTSGAPGVVVMATNYNADAPVYNTKQEMENSEYAVSVKPTRDLIHGVECAAQQTVLPQLYVRSGNPPAGQDKRLYDQGNFQMATQGNPSQLLGELWVSYCVEFFKPILPTDVGGDVLTSRMLRTTASAANPLGTVQVNNIGDLPGFTVTSTAISWVAQPGNYYELTVVWDSGVGVVITHPTLTFTGLATDSIWALPGYPYYWTPPLGTTSGGMSLNLVASCTLSAPGTVTVTFGTAGVIPTASVTIVANQYSSEAA